MKIFCLLTLSVLSLKAIYIPNVDEVCEAGRKKTQINYEAPAPKKGGYVGNVFFQENLSEHVPRLRDTLGDIIFQLKDYALDSSSGRIDFTFSLSFEEIVYDSVRPSQTELHATYFFLSQGEDEDRRQLQASIMSWLEHRSHSLSPAVLLLRCL